MTLQPPEPAGTELDFELVDEEPTPRFVETNQAAPDNIPDDTTDFSARNQQAAQPDRPEELSRDRTPAREGQEEVPFDKVFSGDLEPQVALTPSPEANPEQQQVEASTPQRRDPLPGFEQDEVKSDEGTGSSIADASPKPNPIQERVEGQESENQEAQMPAFTSPLSVERPVPAPRPRLPRATPGPVKRQPVGVSQTGAIGVNARFSEFGEYMERVVEAVSQRWTALCASRSYRESSTNVVIEFKLTRDGMIKDMETVENTAQALGVLLARSAIEQGQSYGPWTKEMVDVLGEEQTITFSFHYW
jgi:hypothetical protein